MSAGFELGVEGEHADHKANTTALKNGNVYACTGSYCVSLNMQNILQS